MKTKIYIFLSCVNNIWLQVPEHLQPQVDQPCLFHLHHPVRGPNTKYHKLFFKQPTMVYKKNQIKTKAIQNTWFTMNYQIANKQFGNVPTKLLQKVNYGTH